MLTLFLATHNGAATLPRVLASYTQLHVPRGGWKLVVIDNGSEDATPQVVDSFRGRLPLVRVSEPRRGKNRALNRGLRELEGDLAVFGDDDGIPDAEWLCQLRAAADGQPAYGVFAGRITPLWEVEPADWMLRWVRLGPVFSATDAARPDGPCEPTWVWGPNMAVRAAVFARGHRFDEALGPTGSRVYAMGGETEFVLRLAIAESLTCWYCRGANVHHVIPARKMTRGWILRRAFHLGRCVRRESRQKAAAGRAYVRRDLPTIVRELARAMAGLTSARAGQDPRGTFEARWQLNLWIGCLFEAVAGRARRSGIDHGLRA